MPIFGINSRSGSELLGDSGRTFGSAPGEINTYAHTHPKPKLIVIGRSVYGGKSRKIND